MGRGVKGGGVGVYGEGSGDSPPSPYLAKNTSVY